MPSLRCLTRSASQRRLVTAGTRQAATHLSHQPVRLTVLALVVLGAFDIGRLLASALIAPWLAEALMGTRSPVVIGDFDIGRIGIEAVAIALGWSWPRWSLCL